MSERPPFLYRCVGCDCVLNPNWDENEYYCCWCEERMKEESE